MDVGRPEVVGVCRDTATGQSRIKDEGGAAHVLLLKAPTPAGGVGKMLPSYVQFWKGDATISSGLLWMTGDRTTHELVRASPDLHALRRGGDDDVAAVGLLSDAWVVDGVEAAGELERALDRRRGRLCEGRRHTGEEGQDAGEDHLERGGRVGGGKAVDGIDGQLL
jgi:hypothetical protein